MIKRAFVTCLLILLAAQHLFAQEAEEGAANYAYSIFVGTGKYEVGDRTVYVVSAPLYVDIVEADFGSRRTGYRILLPAAIGITDFDNFQDLPELNIDTLQTLSFAPGIEAQIPLDEHWLLKPFGQAGKGWDLKNSSDSFIWGLGVRTRAWLYDNEKWLVGGEILWSGNNPDSKGGPDSRFSRLRIGAEYKWQTDWAPFGRRVAWHGRLIQSAYVNKAEFLPPPTEQRLRSATEIGISASIDPPINLFGYAYDQLGLAYENSDAGWAIKLISTFPF